MAGFGGDGDDLGFGIAQVDVSFGAFEVEVEVGHHVHLVDNDEVADSEHERVLKGFVVAFGHGEDHGVAGRAGVELGGADEVSDVFEDDEIDFIKVEVVKSLAGHLRVEVAHAAGMQLNGRHSGLLLDLHCIHIAIDVGLHYGHPHLVLYPVNQLDKGGGLTAAGCGHQVEEKNTFVSQFVPKIVRILLVFSKYALFDFNDFYFVHLYLIFDLTLKVANVHKF